MLGLARSAHDLVVFLEAAAGPPDPGELLDDPSGVEWRGGRPLQWTSIACGRTPDAGRRMRSVGRGAADGDVRRWTDG
ncbi:hypothetical protein AQJ43_29185 [Streptomyces avermitilis]|uniref:Uncharacterized protein n=2 Tax=Streptomyces avermitilis TaxID=33903 RepID=Q82PK7_STRAW|nr:MULTISPECIES: hypothetical protein [Streptomyces]KUN51144.1 hypothetical protein AQJ43_29185 [Streptomyces avermitilis]MYS96537.1 hypothetical protein [Streptomyces sp. SID5469]OOV21090.1 hypothetical protein SM007_35115 [Streptomyces avermitilis]BAC68605.1 hypothetical protein SAVERM_895 [Streptomyces avermitilis MA-4680 = NBRC 14893]BBJ48480.1 hypothetical protein SAVMC3_11090 [Streptomyces avermitilis]